MLAKHTHDATHRRPRRGNWRVAIKRAIPASVLNEVLLRFPALYRSGLVSYETNLIADHGIDDLVAEVRACLSLGGNIAECGSSRCGSSAIIANVAHEAGVRKTVFACDSYQGFDPAELAHERQRGLTTASERAFTSTSFDYVTRKLKALGLQGVVVPVRGYFKDTLPGLPGPLCMVFVDCDLSESMLYCAETLWPRLVAGGRLVFDDYTCVDFAGARIAIDDFVTAHRHEIAEHGLRRRLYVVRKA